LRDDNQSDATPLNSFMMCDKASAKPSIKPTMATLAPSVPVKKRGRIAWAISLDISMKRDAKPNIHTPRGIFFIILSFWPKQWRGAVQHGMHPAQAMKQD
jgi:hypothetical protein